MSAALDIGRLVTRIRSAEPERAHALAGQMRQLADRQLAHALDGASERALARAGLPAEAMVAVQRVDLALKVSADVDERQLAEGWAAAFEAALASLLASAAAGEDGDDAAAVWFADSWAAERRHLERRAAGLPDAWWAPDLATDGGLADTTDATAALEALAILLRWLDRDPPRAVALMAALARADARIAARLDADAAHTLTRRLLALFARRDATEAPNEPTDGVPARHPPAAAPRHLDPALARCADLRAALLAALPTPDPAAAAQAAPWLLAALFAANPALTRLSATGIERALRLWLQRTATGQPPAAPVPPANPPTAATPSASVAEPEAVSVHSEIHAGGLLLLLRPLVRLGLLPEPEQLASRLGDLALTALRRVLAPLPPAERAVAQERERPLLAVFAPECDWRERIATLPIHDAKAADALLDALADAIPADIAFAPGAERRLFGRRPPAFATAPELRLARLLLRPGVLRASPWEAELVWPLAGIDLALRRAGWDQDPGWVPWLGRSIRFRFGDAP